MEPRVGIVILNWNGWQDTVECLDSLRGLTYSNYEVIVVDNASTNDSVAQIRGRFPEIRIIESPENGGFSKGNNLGIRAFMEAGADYVWLLNNDTCVESDALTKMMALAESDPIIGAVGVQLQRVNGPGTVELQTYGGGLIDMSTGRSHEIHRVGLTPDFITAASVLLKKEALEKVGLLDEKFFMYWEDVDLSLRLHKEGWKLIVAEDVIVYHKEGASAGRKSARADAYFTQSLVRFLGKHSKGSLRPLLIAIGGRFIKRVLSANFTGARAVLRGALRREFGPID